MCAPEEALRAGGKFLCIVVSWRLFVMEGCQQTKLRMFSLSSEGRKKKQSNFHFILPPCHSQEVPPSDLLTTCTDVLVAGSDPAGPQRPAGHTLGHKHSLLQALFSFLALNPGRFMSFVCPNALLPIQMALCQWACLLCRGSKPPWEGADSNIFKI